MDIIDKIEGSAIGVLSNLWSELCIVAIHELFSYKESKLSQKLLTIIISTLFVVLIREYVIIPFKERNKH
jgi:hypothetical protein